MSKLTVAPIIIGSFLTCCCFSFLSTAFSSVQVLIVPILQPIHQEDIYQPIRRTLHIFFFLSFFFLLYIVPVSMMSALKTMPKRVARYSKTLKEESLSGGSKSGLEAPVSSSLKPNKGDVRPGTYYIEVE